MKKYGFGSLGITERRFFNIKFYHAKADYIHLYPVRSDLVEKEEEHLHSSAGD